MVEAIANLVNAAATEKCTIETLTTTNATLTAQLAALSEQVHSPTTSKAPTSSPRIHMPGTEPWAQQGHG
jgi:hypothetical protein